MKTNLHGPYEKINAVIIRKDGRKIRKIDIRDWPMEKFNALRSQCAPMGFEVRIEREAP
jgi:hypothetical protein